MTQSKGRPEQLIHVGTVSGTHGLQGELRVYPASDSPERLLALDRLFIGQTETAAREFRVSGTPRPHRFKRKKFLLFQFEGVSSIEAASSLKNQQVYADQQDIPLEDDELFLDDLLGFSVCDPSGERIGTIESVEPMPAHPILVVVLSDGRRRMIPAVPAYIIEIIPESAQLTIELVEGLID